jgi:dihydrofolate reductase
MKLKLIFARDRNGVIGRDGALPWQLPEDMAHFKRTTMGQPVIMGRKTWDSIPEKFRPLAGRFNIVVTNQKDWTATGAKRASSLRDAMSQCPLDATAWVIGGAQIYALAEPLAHGAVVTEIDAEFEGDAHAPAFGAGWTEVSRRPQKAANGLQFSIVTYTHNLGV